MTEGARYQFRFFWRQALQMLCATSVGVERVVVEHRGVDAVDDVVVYYAAPGVKDSGRRVRIEYYQLKYHVSHTGSVSATNLVDPDWTSTKRSLLRRFAESWQDLRKDEPEIRVTLATNWAWHPTDPLKPILRDGGILGDEFFSAGPSTAVGQVRAVWRTELSFLDDAEFALFIGQLRLCPGALCQRESEEWLADRCQLAGLIPPNLAENHSAYDDLAAQLLAQGRREFTPQSLRDLVREENLVRVSTPPFASTCAVRSFRRFAYVPELDSAVVVDLTDLFVEREPISQDVWLALVPERLDAALGRIAALPTPVQLALDTHLSIAWYTGTLLDPKAGVPVVLRQKGLGRVELWDVSVARPEPAQAWRISDERVGDGKDIALAISVTHDVAPEVRACAAAIPSIGTLVSCAVEAPGSAAIRDGAHARWLVDELVRQVRLFSNEREAQRVHVFAAVPASVAFLLGQQSAAIGPITMYEYDFGRTRTYRPAMVT